MLLPALSRLRLVVVAVSLLSHFHQPSRISTRTGLVNPEDNHGGSQLSLLWLSIRNNGSRPGSDAIHTNRNDRLLNDFPRPPSHPNGIVDIMAEDAPHPLSQANGFDAITEESVHLTPTP